MELRKSPFKVARIEDDPQAFGRRVDAIAACAGALYDRRNVLISGPRGIGKSSLGSQLQIAQSGNTTLLERCDISTVLPMYLHAFYACDQHTSLAQMCSDILFRLERACKLAKRFKAENKKVEFELDLKVFRTRIEADVSSRGPSTVVTEFVAGLGDVLRTIQRTAFREGISIMLDELDQVSSDINFGHFFKMVQETLDHDRLQDVTFILAGQRGIYSRLLREDPSTERIVRHVPLSTLDPDESLYVLDFASSHGDPPFEIDAVARDMLACLAAGHPYNLHLLGDAAFNVMEDPQFLAPADVLFGLQGLFMSDKREKYTDRLYDLGSDERLVLVTMAQYPHSTIPMRIPLSWLRKEIPSSSIEGARLDEICETLRKGGHIRLNRRDGYCEFAEELFRVFISLLTIEYERIEEEREDRERKRTRERIDREIIDGLSSGKIDPSSEGIRQALDQLDGSDYTLNWEHEEYSELMGF